MKVWQKTALIAAGVVVAAGSLIGGVAVAQEGPVSEVSFLPLLGLVAFVAVIFTTMDNTDSE